MQPYTGLQVHFYIKMAPTSVKQVNSWLKLKHIQWYVKLYTPFICNKINTNHSRTVTAHSYLLYIYSYDFHLTPCYSVLLGITSYMWERWYCLNDCTYDYMCTACTHSANVNSHIHMQKHCRIIDYCINSHTYIESLYRTQCSVMS